MIDHHQFYKGGIDFFLKNKYYMYFEKSPTFHHMVNYSCSWYKTQLTFHCLFSPQRGGPNYLHIIIIENVSVAGSNLEKKKRGEGVERGHLK